MKTDANTADHGDPSVVIETGGAGVVEQAIAVVMASPAIRDEAVSRGRTLLASSHWCRADEVAAELVRCYAGRLVP